MATEEGAADGRPGLLSELEEYCFDTGGFVVIRSGAHNHDPRGRLVVMGRGGGISGGAGRLVAWVGPGPRGRRRAGWWWVGGGGGVGGS